MAVEIVEEGCGEEVACKEEEVEEDDISDDTPVLALIYIDGRYK